MQGNSVPPGAPASSPGLFDHKPPASSPGLFDHKPPAARTTPAAAGLACRSCGGTTFRTFWQTFRDNSKHVRQECASCKTFVRYLKQQPEAVPSSEVLARATYTPAGPEANGYNTAPPPADAEWVGHVRGSDGLWRPVCLARDLAGCWDALLCYPAAGDLLCIPTERVPRGRGAADEGR
jgi:hypothetical protein